MTEFVVKLAGVSFAIKTEYPEIKGFFRDYLSEEAPMFVLKTKKSNLDNARKSLRSAEESEGRPPHRYKAQELEITALHELMAETMPEYNVFLFHASAIEYLGQGVMFAAVSGTGKSTHANYWMKEYDKASYINDDKPFIALRDGEIFVCGSPWMGKHGLGSNREVPLKAVCVLERAKDSAIERIGYEAAFATLLQQTYRPKNVKALEKTMNLLEETLKEAECYRLQCANEQSAAVVAKKGIFDKNYTYILECGDGTYYCGWTNDLEKRLASHNAGTGSKYTRTRRPCKLAYYEAFETKEEAMSREWHIKKLTRKEKEALIARM